MPIFGRTPHVLRLLLQKQQPVATGHGLWLSNYKDPVRHRHRHHHHHHHHRFSKEVYDFFSVHQRISPTRPTRHAEGLSFSGPGGFQAMDDVQHQAEEGKDLAALIREVGM